MTDIYDIKDIVFPLPISVFNTILVIVVFLLVYFLLFRKRKDFVEIVEEIKEEKIDFREVILDFEKKYLLLESKDFLREISFIFRNFLEQDLGYKNFSKLTLKEIYEAKSGKLKVESLEKNNLENGNLRFTSDILRILEDIYFKEYKEENLTEKEKEKIFLEVKTIILNEEK